MTDLTVFGLRLAALADSTPELRAGLLLAALIAIDEGLQGDQPCKHDCQGAMIASDVTAIMTDLGCRPEPKRSRRRRRARPGRRVTMHEQTRRRKQR